MKKFLNFFLNKRFLNILIVILLLVIYLFLFFRTTIDRLSFLLPETAQLQTKIKQIEYDWANIVILRQKISRLKQKLLDYEKKLPNEKEIAQVLKYLSDSAKRLNVRITEIKPVGLNQQDKESGNIYYSVPILLKAECSYHALGRFLNELEMANRLMKISDIKIEPYPYQTNTIFAQLIVVTYVMTECEDERE